MFCNSCQHWFYKKFSEIEGKLKACPGIHCGRFLGFCKAVDSRPEK